MDGDVAPLAEICDLAERYGALVMVDDSHATGFVGTTGRGTPEHCGVAGRVDIITSTLGKALGRRHRRLHRRPARDRRAPAPALAALPVLEHAAAGDRRRLAGLPGHAVDGRRRARDRLEANTRWFRRAMTEAGFAIRPGVHPIVPIMLGDARLAHRDGGRPAATRASTSSASPTRWCPRARPASACRSAPRTSPSTSTAPWRRS